MRKLAMLFLIQALFIGSAYAAPSRAGLNDVGLELAGMIPNDSANDSTIVVSSNISHGINDWFAVGFEAGWGEMGTDDVTGSGVTIAGPDITGVPLFGDLIVRGHSEDRSWEPYAVLGLGTVIWSIDDTTASGAAAGSVQTDIGTDFAVKLGGGIDWFLNNNWIVNINAAYVFSSPEATVTATASGSSATVTDEVDLDYWTVGGGVKYLFS